MAKRGRKIVAAKGSVEAGAKLEQLMADRNFTQAELARRVRISDRTLLGLRSGERGPTRELAEKIAAALKAPEVTSWWEWPSSPTAPEQEPDAEAGRPAAGEAATATAVEVTVRTGEPAAPGAGRRFIGARLWAVVGAAALVAAVVLAAIIWRRPDSLADPQPAVSPTASATSAATAAADFRGRVNPVMSGRPPAKTIGVWTMPSTNTGCEADPCLPATAQAGKVRAGQQVLVTCLALGQEIRNGDPSQPNFYADNKWLRVSPRENVEQEPGQVVYLSNVFLFRDQLPPGLPDCPT